jgi:hypothetical protein
MTWALRASLLIVIEAHKGQWCTLAFLAGRVVAPINAIQPLCEELVAARLAHFALFHGEPVYGLDVVAEHPQVLDEGKVIDTPVPVSDFGLFHDSSMGSTL